MQLPVSAHQTVDLGHSAGGIRKTVSAVTKTTKPSDLKMTTIFYTTESCSCTQHRQPLSQPITHMLNRCDNTDWYQTKEN